MKGFSAIGSLWKTQEISKWGNPTMIWTPEKGHNMHHRMSTRKFKTKTENKNCRRYYAMEPIVTWTRVSSQMVCVSGNKLRLVAFSQGPQVGNSRSFCWKSLSGNIRSSWCYPSFLPPNEKKPLRFSVFHHFINIDQQRSLIPEKTVYQRVTNIDMENVKFENTTHPEQCASISWHEKAPSTKIIIPTQIYSFFWVFHSPEP